MPAILALNAGSSSVKFALFTDEREPRVITRETIGRPGAGAVPEVVRTIADAEIAAIGHRIVHGGPAHSAPQRITPAIMDDLRSLIPFAPNHLPDEIAIIEAFARKMPDVPQVACFDTAFHRAMPEIAQRLPIPDELHARGVRRYGFHGLSYTYLISELRRLAGDAVADARVILAHLGNGSSLAALRNGQSIDTTMAFTPIGGVVMSTRSGDLDPGIAMFLARNEGMSPDEIEDLLSKRSGLLGVSGVSSDMVTLLERQQSDARCRLAVDMYGYSIAKAIAGLAAALGGIDALVFSGGIGEHAAPIRANICGRLDFLGIRIDAQRNSANAPLISPVAERVQVRVIPTDEEIVIARAAFEVIGRR